MNGQYAYSLDPDREPILYAACDEIFELKVQNAFGGEMVSEQDLENLISTGYHHPLSGPVYIEGIQAGEHIEVQIVDISPLPTGYQCLSRSSGILQMKPFLRNFKIISLSAGKLLYDNYVFEPRYSVGVIGTATKLKTRSGRTGASGGNLDINQLGIHSSIVLPCELDGGLLYAGDIHLLQGAGELSGVAIEVGGTICLKVSKVYSPYLFPVLYLKDAISFLGYGDTIEDAITCATKNAVYFLCVEFSMSEKDAYMLLGALGDLVLGHATGKIVSCGLHISSKYISELYSPSGNFRS